MLEDKDFVIRCIRQIFPSSDVEIIAFGSRVQGTARKYSDLDIALKGPGPLPGHKMIELEERFEESDLPYKVDLMDFSNLSPDFQALVLRTGQKWE